MKLSVVIPAHNRAKLLPATLYSLLTQERVADEILVIDDGSTDDTALVAESFGPPVRVIRQSNKGPGGARNRGLSEARGEFIHFFDSDDLALPNLHAIQLQTLERSGADVAFSPWVKVQFLQSQGVQATNHVLQAHGLPFGSLPRALLTNWSVVPICCLIRRSLVLRIEGFPSFLRGTEDQLFFLRLLLQGAQCIHTPGTLVLYRDEEHVKLTSSSPDTVTLHQIEWAKFLVSARADCLEAGIDPATWFGFRRRVFLVNKFLNKMPNPPASLVQDLEAIIHTSPVPPILYELTRAIQQKGESLTSRTLGRRAHRSFRARLMSDSQYAIATSVMTNTFLLSKSHNKS